MTSTPTYDDHELGMSSKRSGGHGSDAHQDDGSATAGRGDSAGGAGHPHRNETAAERMDRNWNELLQELRVTQTGVQILSGFLLTLPFQQRFSDAG